MIRQKWFLAAVGAATLGGVNLADAQTAPATEAKAAPTPPVSSTAPSKPGQTTLQDNQSRYRSVPLNRPGITFLPDSSSLKSIAPGSPGALNVQYAPASRLGALGEVQVSLDTDHAEPSEAIINLLRSSGVNYVIGGEIKGGRKITARFRQVSLQEALDALSMASGLNYDVQGNIIILLPTGESNAFLGSMNSPGSYWGANPQFRNYDSYRGEAGGAASLNLFGYMPRGLTPGISQDAPSSDNNEASPPPLQTPPGDPSVLPPSNESSLPVSPAAASGSEQPDNRPAASLGVPTPNSVGGAQKTVDPNASVSSSSIATESRLRSSRSKNYGNVQTFARPLQQPNVEGLDTAVVGIRENGIIASGETPPLTDLSQGYERIPVSPQNIVVKFSLFAQPGSLPEKWFADRKTTVSGGLQVAILKNEGSLDDLTSKVKKMGGNIVANPVIMTQNDIPAEIHLGRTDQWRLMDAGVKPAATFSARIEDKERKDAVASSEVKFAVPNGGRTPSFHPTLKLKTGEVVSLTDEDSIQILPRLNEDGSITLRMSYGTSFITPDPKTGTIGSSHSGINGLIQRLENGNILAILRTLGSDEKDDQRLILITATPVTKVLPSPTQVAPSGTAPSR